MPVSFISVWRLMSVVMTNKANRASEGTSDRECSVDAVPATRPELDDATAFDELVAVHFHDVNRLVNRLLGWSDGADDIVQEVFLSVLKNIGKFRGDSSISTWLTRITVNKCRSHRRRLRVRLRLLAGAAERVRRTHQEKTDTALTDGERFSRVRRAVQALPVRYREVVVLRYLEETPTDEVAEVLGVSRSAVDVRLHRAREKLKDMLADLIEE